MTDIIRYTVKLVKEECKEYEIDNPINNVGKAAWILNTIYDFEHLTTEMFVILELLLFHKVLLMLL